MAKPPASGSGPDPPKAAPQDDAETVQAWLEAAPKARGRGGRPPARKGILIRVHPEGWKALRHLAIEKSLEAGRTVTLQEVMLEAVNDYLQKNGMPPTA